ncbi:hypothetical protein BJX96DRAFT_170079 [Aspergillus floccosus]
MHIFNIIGAGAGGLATAARLAQEGYAVKVIERHGYVGGRCSIISQNGYNSALTKGHHSKRKLDLLKCESNCCIWFPDCDMVELSTDLSQLKREIQRYEGEGSFPRPCAFLEEAGRYYHLCSAYVLHKSFPSIFSVLRILRPLMQMRPWSNVYGCASRYFRSEKFRRVLAFASMYMGMNPYQAPGTYTIVRYSETVDGIWYPRGGFSSTIADIATRLGVEYQFDTPVEKDVRLATGEELYADVTVVNADLVYAHRKFLPPSSRASSLSRCETSCSSISFFWAFNEVLPNLRPHNIFLAKDYKESFDAIFDKHSIPDDPSFYVNVPSRVDPTAAPPSKEAIVVLVPVGSLTDSTRDTTDSTYWHNAIKQVKRHVLETIEHRTGMKDLGFKIVHERIETPLTWQEKYNLDCCAILGLSHSFSNVLSFRPKNKHPSISNLYFVGASTHPGTGVPICLAGAKRVATEILDDHRTSKLTSILEQVI